MNIFKDLTLSTEKPAALSIIKTQKSQIMTVGLGDGAVLKKHKTSVFTNLIMMKGRIDFIINEETLSFSAGDVYEIPIDVEHEVVGKDVENIFLIIKEL